MSFSADICAVCLPPGRWTSSSLTRRSKTRAFSVKRVDLVTRFQQVKLVKSGRPPVGLSLMMLLLDRCGRRQGFGHLDQPRDVCTVMLVQECGPHAPRHSHGVGVECRVRRHSAYLQITANSLERNGLEERAAAARRQRRWTAQAPRTRPRQSEWRPRVI